MNKSKTILHKVFKRQGYDLNDDLPGKMLITKSKKGNKILRSNLYVFGILVVIGILVLGYISSLVGAILLCLFFPLYRRLERLRGQYTFSKVQEIVVSRKGLIIKERQNTLEVSVDEIDQLLVDTEKDKQVSRAVLILKCHGKQPIELMHLFGQSRQYVYDDACIVADHMSDLLFAEVEPVKPAQPSSNQR